MVKFIYKKFIGRYITHKFSCGEDAAKWVYGAKNIDDVIYMKNAIDANEFRYSKKIDDEVREEFGLEGKFVIGHVGRFFEQKNHPFIVKVFAEVAKQDPSAVLILVGGGELDDAIMNQIKDDVNQLGLSDKVIFTGVRSDVKRIMQAFDVFILPSLYEGFPVVMVEAQATGLKCLISDKVPSECDITGNVEIIPLSDGEKVWADHILAYKNGYKKQDMYQTIVNAGYDIKENSKWLEEFYIDALKAVSK